MLPRLWAPHNGVMIHEYCSTFPTDDWAAMQREGLLPVVCVDLDTGWTQEIAFSQEIYDQLGKDEGLNKTVWACRAEDLKEFYA